MDAKPWYESKELIVAAVSLLSGWAQSHYGWIISPETQLSLTVVAMAVLRAFFTKGPVTLRK